MASNYLRVHDDVTWKRAKKVFIHDGSTWKPVKRIFIDDDGSNVWKEVFNRPPLAISVTDTSIVFNSNSFPTTYAQVSIRNDGDIEKNESGQSGNFVANGSWTSAAPETGSGDAYEVQIVWNGTAGEGPVGWAALTTDRIYGVTQIGNGTISREGEIFIRGVGDTDSGTSIGNFTFDSLNGYTGGGGGGGDPPE